MTKILLQSGHSGLTSGATGAPEEMANNLRIRNRLSQILISKGFQLFLADANYSSNEHFDLALAVHCDSNYTGNEGGGFVACADPSIDKVWTESDRIRDAIDSMYFDHTGIRRVQSRENANTLYYYWWYNLSLDTPCVLIEMGESIDPHDKVILADTDRVANALARGICKAFGVAYDTITPPTPTVPMVTIKKSEYESMKVQIAGFPAQLSQKDTQCKNKFTESINKIKVFLDTVI